MSAFDDEFGLFGEGSEEIERRPTLGARKIASSETSVDNVERDSEAPPRPARPPRPQHPQHPPRSQRPPVHRGPRRDEGKRNATPGDPWAGHRRAAELLGFLARKLVQKPDAVTVELFMDEQAQPVIELVVDPDDLGKVIGRSGRVAHALRTIVRATAEGRVSVDILDSEEAAQGLNDDGEGE